MSLFQFKRTESNDPDFQFLIRELDLDLRNSNGEEMDTYDQHNLIVSIGTVIVAYKNGVPAGCGCFKSINSETIEVKRIFVRPENRGEGLSKLVISELENWATEIGCSTAVLETSRQQLRAIMVYSQMGYEQTANYGPYVGLKNSVCFKKRLDS